MGPSNDVGNREEEEEKKKKKREEEEEEEIFEDLDSFRK